MSVPHSLDLRLIFHSFQFCHVWVGCHIFLFLIQENIYKYTYSIHVCKRHSVPYFPYATSWFHPRNSSQSTSKYVKADTHAQRINYAKSIQIMEVCQRQILTGYVITIQKMWFTPQIWGQFLFWFMALLKERICIWLVWDYRREFTLCNNMIGILITSSYLRYTRMNTLTRSFW